MRFVILRWQPPISIYRCTRLMYYLFNPRPLNQRDWSRFDACSWASFNGNNRSNRRPNLESSFLNFKFYQSIQLIEDSLIRFLHRFPLSKRHDGTDSIFKNWRKQRHDDSKNRFIWTNNEDRNGPWFRRHLLEREKRKHSCR